MLAGLEHMAPFIKCTEKVVAREQKPKSVQRYRKRLCRKPTVRSGLICEASLIKATTTTQKLDEKKLYPLQQGIYCQFTGSSHCLSIKIQVVVS
jgi:hypothetical protein